MAQNQWGNIDQANNAPIWGPSLVGTKAGTGTANTANREALYQNATANAFTVTDAHSNGVTTGVYAVAVDEMANTSGEAGKVHSAGWVLRTEAPNGRIRYETLVAMRIVSDPTDSDDALFPTGSSTSASVSTSPSSSASSSPSPSVSSSPSPSVSSSPSPSPSA